MLVRRATWLEFLEVLGPVILRMMFIGIAAGVAYAALVIWTDLTFLPPAPN